MKYKKLVTFSDGGARGNPGPSGIGAVIKNENGENIEELSEYIGETTNNQAEYKALIMVMKKAKDYDVDELECFLDSELVVKQLNKEYKVKNKDLQTLFVEVYNNSLNFKKVTYAHVRREFNKEADALANVAMDEHSI